MTILTMRPYLGEADLRPICDLLNYCDAVDNLDDNYAVEDLRLEFSDPRLDSAHDLRLWEDGDGQLVGFGQTWIPEDGETVDGFLYFRVHPSARDNGLASEILAWGGERLREVGRERGLPVQLRSSAREHDAFSRGVLEQHGMAPIRYFFQMRCPLDEPIEPARLPDGFTLRHVASEADVEAWVDTFNQSFIDHWNHHPMTVEGHKHWLSHASYSPERDLVVLASDGMFAAFCFCIIDPEDNARNQRNDGWIGILGTRRGYRKLGLGRAMLLHGLHALKAAGLDTAKLNVDAENPTGALRLYESVGFVQEHTSISYRKDL
jgi:mycothiol synthase